MKVMKLLFAVMVLVSIGHVVLAGDSAAPVSQADPVEFISLILSKWYLVAMTVISMASVVVNLTPSETDNKVLSALDSILNVLAGNFNVKGIVQKVDSAVDKKYNE